MILSAGKKYSSSFSDLGGSPPKNSTSVFRKWRYPGIPVRGRRLTRAFCFVTKSPWINLLGEYTITGVAFSSGARVYIVTSNNYLCYGQINIVEVLHIDFYIEAGSTTYHRSSRIYDAINHHR